MKNKNKESDKKPSFRFEREPLERKGKKRRRFKEEKGEAYKIKKRLVYMLYIQKP